MRTTYEALMRNRRSCSVQPCLLVHMSWGHKCGCCHLFCIQSKAHVARAVLALWDSPWHRFRFEVVVESGHVLVGVILASAKRWDLAILLGFSPVEDLLILSRVLK
jgi:hypothetical protein